MSEIPQTTAVCDGTGEEFNMLNPHLEVSLRPVRQRLVSEEASEGDENYDKDSLEMGEPNVYLGTKAGRGVNLKFKDFDAAISWFRKRKGLEAKLQLHREDVVKAAKDVAEAAEEGV